MPIKIHKSNDPINPINNETGFVLVMAMLILIVLVVIGVTTIKGTKTDIRIAGNERWQKNRFFVVDSAWQDATGWLNGKAATPRLINMATGDNGTIKNPGGGASGQTTLNDNATDGNLNSIPYWYSITELSDKKAVKFGKDYRQFRYAVQASADRTSNIEAQLDKVFKVGY